MPLYFLVPQKTKHFFSKQIKLKSLKVKLWEIQGYPTVRFAEYLFERPNIASEIFGSNCSESQRFLGRNINSDIRNKSTYYSVVPIVFGGTIISYRMQI